MSAERRSRPAILAVDGGNSKADAVMVDRAGAVLGLARTVAPSNVGRSDGSWEAFAEVIAAAAQRAGLEPGVGPLAQLGVFCLAGADTSREERSLERALSRRGWTTAAIVRNDTVAVLRAGTDRGWGIGVVCGAGINAVGVGPTGRTVRFAALGELSGDLAAGGEWVGTAALGAAVRARDGRGTRTVLERIVPAHFDVADAETLARAMYRDRIPSERLVELPPAVFRAAGDGDVVARGILDRLADEVVAMATAAINRLRVADTDVDVVLGGGMFRSDDGAFLERIRDGVEADAPRARTFTLTVPPVVGAVLLGLDRIGASAKARARVRDTVSHRSLAAMNGTGRRKRVARVGAAEEV
jgi:N-acetylglucosamine kinase-like BadF-type ATPase